MDSGMRLKVGRRSLTMMAGIVAAVLALSACSGSVGAPTPGARQASASEPVVGMTVYNMSGFESTSEPGVLAEAKALGLKLEWDSANGDLSQQVSEMETFISEHVAAIILDPVQSISLASQMAAAKAAGIPVVVTNAPLVQPGTHPTGQAVTTGNSPYQAAYAGPNDILAGYHEMQALAQALHGKGNIVELQGPLGQGGQESRTLGIGMALKHYPGIHLLAQKTADWLRPEAYTVMSGFWSAYGSKITGVVAENDDMAIGVNRVLALHGVEKKIPVVGIDGIMNGMQAVKSGAEVQSNLQDGLVEEGEAVWLADQIIKHRAHPKNAVYVMPELKKANVGHYYDQMYVHVKAFLRALPGIIAKDMKTGKYSAQ